MGSSFYLYGIFPPPGPVDLVAQGLDKQPVQLQGVDGLVFLYSEAQQERYLASRRNLLDHEKVLEQAMHQGYRILLPLQFGLIIDDWNRVLEDLIRPQREGLLQLFARLEGQREVGVKVFWDSDQELKTLMAENDRLRSERDRLEGKLLNMEEVVHIGQEIERALADRQQAVMERFQSVLDPLASDVVENDPMTDSMIYNAAYLIPWDLEPQFGEQVELLDQEFNNRLRIRYNNFTAPYNFARLETL